MRFHYVERNGWPELAWLAQMRPGDPVIEVQRGPRVEVTDDWYGEIAWAGRYEDGAFDTTEVVAGSGGVLRHDGAYFVSPGSTVERLHSLRTDSATYVSNSLACLLAATGATAYEPARGFATFFRSIAMGGLTAKDRKLESSSGSIELTYFHNLHWNGQTLAEVQKPDFERDFSTFQAYKSFLDDSMASFSQNASSPARRQPMRLLASLSSGYDSSMIAATARHCGLAEVLLFDSDRSEERHFHRACQDRNGTSAQDSGKDTAEALGLRGLSVAHDAWLDGRLPEAPFLAADAGGQEIFMRGAEKHLSGTVLLTGFHGDSVWGKDTPDDKGNLTRRHNNPAGGSLSEYRLSAGFLHAPVPYWGARQLRDIVRLSNSSELEPWDVPGDYSRPICRRIVEESGVPREAFGTVKQGGSVFLLESKSFLSEASLHDFHAWLDNHPEVFGTSKLNRRLGRRWRLDRTLWAALPYDSLIGHAGIDGHRPSLPWRAAWRLRNRAHEIAGRIPTPRHWVFPWATERTAEAYAPAASAAP